MIIDLSTVTQVHPRNLGQVMTSSQTVVFDTLESSHTVVSDGGALFPHIITKITIGPYKLVTCQFTRTIARTRQRAEAVRPDIRVSGFSAYCIMSNQMLSTRETGIP